MVWLLSLPGGGEWLIILLVILLLFGGKKIPELMRGIGRGIREFQRARHTVEDEIRRGMEEADREAESAQGGVVRRGESSEGSVSSEVGSGAVVSSSRRGGSGV